MPEENKENRESFIKRVAVPNLETRKRIVQTFRDVTYYLLIGVISIAATFVIPLISGSIYGDIGLNFPTTEAGWVVYITLRVGLSFSNIGIFILFKKQALYNVRNDETYNKACDIINSAKASSKRYIPLSPRRMNFHDYSTKAFSILVWTLTSTVIISSLIISFDFITFLSCIVSVITTIIFGWTTMIQNEDYWTEEFYIYALYYKERMDEKYGRDNSSKELTTTSTKE